VKANREQQQRDGDVAIVAAAAVGLALIAWMIPTVVVAVSAREAPDCSPVRAIAGTLKILGEGRWSEPASAYPARVREQMPEAAVWWGIAGGCVLLVSTAAVAAWRRLEPQVARDRLGRRPYDWRGARPRPWARPRDLRDLTASGCDGGQFSLGSIDGRRLRSEPETHVVVVAPTRSGKTTRCVIPWLLEHEGTAIVTSTKRDVLDATRTWRESQGRIWIYDPFSRDSARWDPLHGCEEWSRSLREAQWLADSTQDGDNEVARFWRGEAAKLLAPLMHAAALEAERVDAVITWLDTQEAKEPARILNDHGAVAAAHQLKSTVTLDPRNRGTTYMSAGAILGAYRFPEVLATADDGITPELFFDGTPQTLYLVAGDRDQQLLTPLMVGLLSTLLHGAAERAARQGPLNPTLRVLIDEAANVAPLRELPRLLSQAAGHGVRMATIWQSLAQLREHYGHAGDTVLANSTTKLFMGPITDEATRRYVVDLLGPESRGGMGRAASKAATSALQQLGTDRALLVAGAAPPAVVATTPWWRDRGLRRRASP
jgi:type IV secretion system protein VirD4